MLSRYAQRLLERVRRGDWYPKHDDRTPKAMQELIDAGLVTTIVRAKTMTVCWAPVGAQSMICDTYPRDETDEERLKRFGCSYEVFEVKSHVGRQWTFLAGTTKFSTREQAVEAAIEKLNFDLERARTLLRIEAYGRS